MIESNDTRYKSLQLGGGGGGGVGRWLLCRLLTGGPGGLTICRQTVAFREHLASDVGTDRQKIFFVDW